MDNENKPLVNCVNAQHVPATGSPVNFSLCKLGAFGGRPSKSVCENICKLGQFVQLGLPKPDTSKLNDLQVSQPANIMTPVNKSKGCGCGKRPVGIR
jgi:hypothetical protein